MTLVTRGAASEVLVLELVLQALGLDSQVVRLLAGVGEGVLELDYWERFNAEDGITDEVVAASAQRFRKEFDELETILAKQEFLFFDSLSLLDVAWFVYVTRMKLASYPIETLHPRVDSWYETLKSRPVFSEEAQVPDQVRAQLAERRVREANEGKSLVQLAGFSA